MMSIARWALPLLLAVAAIFGSPGSAFAQDAGELLLVGSPEHAEEVGAIQTQVDWAAALYVEGILATVLGLGGGTFGFICCGVGFGLIMGLAGWTVGLIGLVSLGVAVGFDVDSGPRRDRLEARTRHALQRHVPGSGLDDNSTQVGFRF